jgi:hypothetical protein
MNKYKNKWRITLNRTQLPGKKIGGEKWKVKGDKEQAGGYKWNNSFQFGVYRLR